MPSSPPHPESIRLVALVCLTVVLVTAIAGLTVVACTTSRDLRLPESLTFLGAVLLCVLGGLSLRHAAGWRMNGGGGVGGVGDENTRDYGPPRYR